MPCGAAAPAIEPDSGRRVRREFLQPALDELLERRGILEIHAGHDEHEQALAIPDDEDVADRVAVLLEHGETARVAVAVEVLDLALLHARRLQPDADADLLRSLQVPRAHLRRFDGYRYVHYERVLVLGRRRFELVRELLR